VKHGNVALATSLLLAGALSLTPVALAQEDGLALPAPGEALGEGRYSTDIVGPTISFDGSDGWLVGPTGPGPIFTLLRADEPGTVVSVTRFDGAVFVDSCDPTSLSEVEASAPRLMAVIAGNPYLNPAAPVRIEVDGRDAWQVDVATPEYTECPLEFLLLFALPIAEGGEFVQVADQQSRFIAVEIGDTVVVVAIESLPGVPFGELLEASLELVASMELEPGEPGIPPEVGSSPPASPEADASPTASPFTPSDEDVTA
jgi:hypothetical protein